MARILVAGGSLGGLTAANLLARAGHEVQVLEKAAGSMDGRGAGIVTHTALVHALRRCGLPEGEALGVPIPGRITLDADGGVLGETVLPQVLTSWSRLYHLLRGLLPEGTAYRQGVTVESVAQDKDGVRVRTNTGSFDADLLIAADGIRSAVRNQLWPDIEPQYAGYIAWRGLTDEAVLSGRTRGRVFERFGFCLPPSEQFLGYPVAGAGNRTDPGHRAWNFVWYRGAPAPRRLAELLTDADGVHHPLGIPPNRVHWREIALMREDARRLLAPDFAEIVEKCAQPFLQPIFDVVSSQLTQGRVALLGDAAFVARPHVGMGVTKAMQDAVALADAVVAQGATAAALSAYESARLGPGRDAVDRARRLGAYMQSCGSGGAPLARNAHTVMAETAIDLDLPSPESEPQAGARPASTTA